MTRDIAVVTGSSGGLGGRIIARLLRDGFDVVGVARRDVSPEAWGDGPGSYAHLQWDLSETGSIKALVDRIVRDFGAPFGLVNNAAEGTDGLLPTMHDSDIERIIRTNLTSPVLLAKYLVRPMLSARRGRIVNIGSIVARTGYRGLAAYSATKSGLEGFTRSLARDVGPRGVTVNTVAPGFLETEMTKTLGAHDLERIRGRSALQRFATLDEVAAAVGFLLSEAGGGITGTVMTVDAGATA